ncbi:biotin transporter BioY [Mangrovicoccus ximenensis]|uniref:biotin transporter BioY n=1 Tax=Mangrovicoccus ximenensis TaxID=1911570 RepID=UPI0013750119|nr:biotin transporter BioY [Mangrovicoccus ximenensis]
MHEGCRAVDFAEADPPGHRRGIAGPRGPAVFSGGKAGLVALTGPTGGYIAGFVIAALFAGFARDRGWTRSLSGAVAAALIATALVFPTGLWQLGNVIGWDKPVLALGLTPFIFGGIFKSLIAGFGAWALARRSV